MIHEHKSKEKKRQIFSHHYFGVFAPILITCQTPLVWGIIMWIILSQLSAQRVITNKCLRFCLKQGGRWTVALALYAWIAESSVCNCHALTNSKRPFVCFALTLQIPHILLYLRPTYTTAAKTDLTIPWRINALFSHYLLILPVDGVAVRERLLVESTVNAVLTAVVVAPCWSTEPVLSTMSFRTLTSKPQLDS